MVSEVGMFGVSFVVGSKLIRPSLKGRDFTTWGFLTEYKLGTSSYQYLNFLTE